MRAFIVPPHCLQGHADERDIPLGVFYLQQAVLRLYPDERDFGLEHDPLLAQIDNL